MMAIRHGLAGQFGKSEAAQRTWRVFLVIVVITCLGFLGYGFVWGYCARNWGNVWGGLAVIVPVVVCAVILWIAWRRFEPYMDRVSKERIKYMRGGQAEALVAWLLQDLDDRWHIFNGVKLEEGSDHDHVLVGPGGVFCISTKSNRGLFARAGDGLLYNGQPSKFGDQVQWQAMELKKRLAALLGADVPWVEAVLAVPFGWTQGETRGSKFWLVHQDNIIDQLAPPNAPTKLNSKQTGRVVQAMTMIQGSAAEVFQKPAAPSP